MAVLLADIEGLERHLGMAFHRFIRGDARQIEIGVNENTVTAWDPFLEHHEATIQRSSSHAAPEVTRRRGFDARVRRRLQELQKVSGAL